MLPALDSAYQGDSLYGTPLRCTGLTVPAVRSPVPSVRKSRRRIPHRIRLLCSFLFRFIRRRSLNRQRLVKPRNVENLRHQLIRLPDDHAALVIHRPLGKQQHPQPR